MEAAKVTNNLGEIETVVANGIKNQILQLVDNFQQVLAERSHCERRRGREILMILPK